jgi:hypothetical protein
MRATYEDEIRAYARAQAQACPGQTTVGIAAAILPLVQHTAADYGRPVDFAELWELLESTRREITK